MGRNPRAPDRARWRRRAFVRYLPRTAAELERLLNRPKLAAQLERKGLTAQEVLARYVELAQVIDASPIEEARLGDPDDAAVLACALAAHADAIVSGDADLQTLGTYDGNL